MKARKLLDALLVAERLKDTTRHCYTAKGRHESVAEHSWMMTLMAFFMRDEFPEVDMDKVIRMCIIHDLGECFTGDIPTFDKNQNHEESEKNLLYNWISSLPQKYAVEMKELYEEMAERKTMESKIYKSIDSLEALIQHNISDLSTWIPKEFDLNLTYADDKVAFSDYLKTLRQAVREDTIKKIEAGK
ncbi:HD domain-containing protein [Hathewaya massiliensis]|uniref:HD domain-containing protein n=1 Tax=Hathewaya massiliensis TaxID=1964382 RepID=UPI00115B8041|nr:HD domain-containing protein [Hathewaya massiliensis]